MVRKRTYDNTQYIKRIININIKRTVPMQLTGPHSLRLKLTIQPSESCSREEVALYEVGETLSVK